jgi:hypothetical protein
MKKPLSDELSYQNHFSFEEKADIDGKECFTMHEVMEINLCFFNDN